MSDASPVVSAEHASEHPTVTTYLLVALVLTIVTGLEVGVIYVRRLAPVVVPLLLAMSAAKFALVALFYMHLRYESRVLTFLFVGPLILASGIVVALMTLAGAFLVFGR